MSQFDEQDRKKRGESFRATIMLIAFGLSVLGFLVAIDRAEWFHIRPVSLTAVAMSLAAANEAEPAKP